MVIAGVSIGRPAPSATWRNVLANAALEYLAEQGFVDFLNVNPRALDCALCGSDTELGGVYVLQGSAVGANRSTGG